MTKNKEELNVKANDALVSIKRNGNNKSINTISSVSTLIYKYIELLRKKYRTLPEKNVLRVIRSKLTNPNEIRFDLLVYQESNLLTKLLVYSSGDDLLLVKRLVEEIGLTKLNVFIIRSYKIKDNNSSENIEKKEVYPLYEACEKGKPEIVEYLINKGASIYPFRILNLSPQNILNLAGQSSKAIQTIKTLLKNGCPNDLIEEYLEDLQKKNDPNSEIVRLLTEAISQKRQFIIACKSGNIASIKQLLDQNIYVDSYVNNKRTGLFYAVENGHLDSVKLLIDKGASIKMKDANGRTCLDTILKKFDTNKNYNLIFQLLFDHAFNIQINEDDTVDTVIKKMVTSLVYKSRRYNFDTDRDIILLRKLVQSFSKLNFIDLKDNIDSYSSWIEEQELKDKDYYGSYLSDDSDSELEPQLYDNDEGANEAQSILKSEPIQNLKNNLKESFNKQEFKVSSPQVMNDDGTKISPLHARARIDKVKTDKQKSQNINKINKDLATSPYKTVLEKNPSARNLYYATYRGYTYITTKWNQDARRLHRSKNEVGKRLDSMAVQFVSSNTSNFKDLNKFETRLSEEERLKFDKAKLYNSTLIKEKLQLVSEIKDARLSINDSNVTNLNIINNFTYDNLSELLQTVYSTDYDLYFKLLNTDFFKNRLLSEHSPFISTAETPYHALRYAYGIKTFPGHQKEVLQPRWRKDGKAERPYSGKAYIILHKLDDLDSAHRITEMLFDGRSIVPQKIPPEREVSYPGSLDDIVYQHIAKYPSFKGPYKKIFLSKYGLDEESYKLFKHFLFNSMGNKDKMEFFKTILGEFLCAFHEMRFVKLATLEANKKNGTLVYLDELGKIKFDGLPALYTTPYSKLKEDSPQKTHKNNHVENEKLRRKQEGNYNFLVDNQIFNSQSKRNLFIKQIINDFNDKGRSESLPKQLQNIKNTEALISKIKEIESKFSSILHFAIIASNTEFSEAIINNLSSNKIDFSWEILNLRDKHGNTPLHIAYLNGNWQLQKLLLDKGADPHILNNKWLKPGEILSDISLKMSKKAKVNPTPYTNNIKPQNKPKGMVPRKLFSNEENNSVRIDRAKYITNAVKNDDEVNKNAFNQRFNKLYWYQTYDIEIIGRHVFNKEFANSNITFLGVLGGRNNSDLLNIYSFLDKNKNNLHKTVGIYNVNNNHWISFCIIKQKDMFFVFYKDSLGIKRNNFEIDFNETFKKLNLKANVYQILPGQIEQFDSSSCGIFSLKNISVMARTMIKDEKISILDRLERALYFNPTNNKEFKSIFHERQCFADYYAEAVLEIKINEKLKQNKMTQERILLQPYINELATSLQETLNEHGIKPKALKEKDTDDTIEDNTLTIDIFLNAYDSNKYGFRLRYANNISLDKIVKLNNLIIKQLSLEKNCVEYDFDSRILKITKCDIILSDISLPSIDITNQNFVKEFYDGLCTRGKNYLNVYAKIIYEEHNKNYNINKHQGLRSSTFVEKVKNNSATPVLCK